MMIIVPKISEVSLKNNENIKSIVPYISNCLEIQLLSSDFLVGLKNSCDVIDKFSTLKEVILHLPLNKMYIDVFSLYEPYKKEFMELLKESITYSKLKNIKIYILFHLHSEFHTFKDTKGLEFLKYCLELVKDTNVKLILENGIIDFCTNDALNTEEVFKVMTKEGGLNFCLDLCHWQASKNIVGKYLELDNLLPFLYSIHFSATLNNDGYNDKKKTHGRKHNSLSDCIKDLKLLREKRVNIDNVKIVAEINEDDYISRKDLLTELQYLNEINKSALLN